jgi:CheY-like chemotaxis protein
VRLGNGALAHEFTIVVPMSREPAPANLALLLGIAERLTAQGNDQEALAELQHEIEKIQGAASSSGFLDASRLAAGMEATVADWATRPDDGDVDRGSVTLWFVTRLAAMLQLDMPRRAATPRSKTTGATAPRRTPGIPAPKSVAPPPNPSQVPAPPSVPRRPLIIRRPSAVRPSPPSPAPAPAPAPAPPPQSPELTWLIPPDAAFPADLADAVAPAATPEPLAESAPPTPPEAQLSLRFPPLSAPPADAATPVEPPAPEAPAVAPPPTPEPQPILAAPPVEQPAPEAPAVAPPPTPEPQPTLAAPPVEPPAPEAPAVAPPPTPEPQPIAESSAEPQPIEVAATVAEVIFVEDDAALAELLEYGLQSRGYRFVSYRNGREALRELVALDVQGTRPLLLLDVDLPGLDGYSVFDALQRERPGTYRVVFTTVHGTEEEQLRGLEAGALDYMVKPISLRVALEKIKRWVGR